MGSRFCAVMKHNQVVANIHYKKWWQRYVRTWFDQAGRKERRRANRQKKAAAIAPRPTAGSLRPAVHCMTQRYNTKVRLSKGFTLDELKEAGIPKKLARTIGVAVDHRRKNRSTEGLQENVARLKLYKSKLMVLPRKSKAKKGDTTRQDAQNVPQNTTKEIIPLPRAALKEKARAITDEEKAFSAKTALRTAWANKHYDGRKRKRAEDKAKAAESAK